MKRRWENGEGDTGRYWEVEVRGGTVLTSSGPLGRSVKARRKDHGDELEAEFWVEQAARRMEELGYIEVVAEAVAEPVQATAKVLHAPTLEPQAPVDPPLDRACSALRAAPEARASYQELCRALSDEEDAALAGLLVRGLAADTDVDELIEWQLWLRKHRRALYGVVPASLLQVSWRFGLPWAVAIPETLADHQPQLLRALGSAPIFRYLLDVQIQPVQDAATLAPLAHLPALVSVRVAQPCARTTAALGHLPNVG